MKSSSHKSLKVFGAQAEGLHGLLLAKQDESAQQLKDVFVHQELPIALTSVMKDVIGDSIILQGLVGEAGSNVLKRFAEKYTKMLAELCQVVVQDDHEIRDHEETTQSFSMGKQFNMEIFACFTELSALNASLAEESRVERSSLNMSGRAIIGGLITCLQHCLESHVEPTRDLFVRHEMRSTSDVNEHDNATLRQLQATLAYEQECRAACETKAQDIEITKLLRERDDAMEQHRQQMKEQRYKTTVLPMQYQKAALELNQLHTAIEGMESSSSSVNIMQRSPTSLASRSTLNVRQPHGSKSLSASLQEAMNLPGQKRPFANLEDTSGGGQHVKKPYVDTFTIAAHASPIPPSRSMNRILDVTVNMFSNGRPPALSTREGLRLLLGGNTKCHYVTVGPSASFLAKELQVRSYFLLDAVQHPWLPTGPGKHGYAFISPTGINSALESAEDSHVFVGTHRTSGFNYVGKYRAQRVGDLTVAEWATLPESFHQLYGKKTLNRDRDSTVKEIVDLHNVGKLRVPCIRLECIDFNTVVYERLADANLAVRRQCGSLTHASKRQKKSSKGKRRDDTSSETAESEDE